MAAAAPGTAAPDGESQQIYDELNRRGAFKDPEAQAIGHELRRRGVVHDPTQGGLVQPPATPALPPATPAAGPQSTGAPPVLPAFPLGTQVPLPPPAGDMLTGGPASPSPGKPLTRATAMRETFTGPSVEPGITAPATTAKGFAQTAQWIGTDIAPAATPTALPTRGKPVGYKVAPEEMALRTADRSVDTLPAFVHQRGYHVAEGGPVAKLQQNQRVATVNLGRALPGLLAQWDTEDRRLQQQAADLDQYAQAHGGLGGDLTTAQDRAITRRQDQLRSDFTAHEARRRQLSSYTHRLTDLQQRFATTPLHSGPLLPGEQPSQLGPVGEAIAGFMPGQLVRNIGFEQRLPVARAALMLRGEYPQLPDNPGKTPLERARIDEQTKAVRRLFFTDFPGFGLRPNADVGTQRWRDWMHGQVGRLTPWQQQLVPVFEGQVLAERKASDAAQLSQLGLADIGLFGASMLGAHAAGKIVGPIASRLLQPLEERLINTGVGRFALHAIPRLATGAASGAAAGGIFGGGGALAAGARPGQIGREALTGAKAGARLGAFFAGVETAPDLLKVTRDYLGTQWDPKTSPQQVEDLAAAHQRVYGLSDAETNTLKERLTRIGKSPGPLKNRQMTALRQSLEQARTAKIAAVPEGGTTRAAPPAPPSPPPMAPPEPRITTESGTSVSLRHLPPEEVARQGHAANARGDTATVDAAARHLQAHADYETHAGTPVPIEHTAAFAKAVSDPGNPEMAPARALKRAAATPEVKKAGLSGPLTDAAQDWERDHKLKFLRDHGVEMPTAAAPAEVAPWRKLSPDQQAAVPVEVKKHLLVQDISNSQRVLDPEASPIFDVKDVPGRVRRIETLEGIANDLFDRAQGAFEQQHAAGLRQEAPQAEVPAEPVKAQAEALSARDQALRENEADLLSSIAELAAEAPPAPVQPAGAAPAPTVSPEASTRRGAALREREAQLLPSTAVEPVETSPSPAEAKPHELTQREFQQRYGQPEDLWPNQALAPVMERGKPGIQREPTQVRSPADPEQAFVFRDEKGKALGTLAFHEQAGPQGEKRASGIEVYVEPEVRGQGVASKLYDALGKAGYKLPELGSAGRQMTFSGAALYHARAVREALQKGEAVPENVLADYPKLQSQMAEGRRPGGTIDAATGLGNEAAWTSTARKPAVAVLRVSHEQAPPDALLAAVGDSLRKAGLGEDAFHLGNGEIRVTADDPKDLAKRLAAAKELLAAHQVVSDQEGAHAKGIDVNYGIGKTEGEAEGKLVREPAAAGPPGGNPPAARAGPERPAGQGAGPAAGAAGKPATVTRGEIKEGLLVDVSGTGAQLKVLGTSSMTVALEGKAPVTTEKVQVQVVRPDKAAGFPAHSVASIEVPKFLASTTHAAEGMAEEKPKPKLRARKGAIVIGPLFGQKQTSATPSPKFPTPELEDWFAKNTEPEKPPTTRQKLRDALTQAGHGLTRVYPDLPATAEFGPVQNALLHLSKLVYSAPAEAMFRMHDAVQGLDPKTEFPLFMRALGIKNLQANVRAGTPNPPAIESLPAGTLDSDEQWVDTELAANPKVQDAVTRWRGMIGKTFDDLNQSRIDIGLPMHELTREDWVHQEVVKEQAKAALAKGGGGSMKLVSHLIDAVMTREGGHDFITDPIQAHLKVIADAIRITAENNVIKLVQQQHDKMPQWKAQQSLGKNKAAAQWLANLAGVGGQGIVVSGIPDKVGQMAAAGMLPDTAKREWRDVTGALAQNWALNQARAPGTPVIPLDPNLTGRLSDYAQYVQGLYRVPPGQKLSEVAKVPPGYVFYSFTEGMPLFRAYTIPQALAQEAINNAIAQITDKDVRKVLALGKDRNVMLLPEGLAKTLTDMRLSKPTELDRLVKSVAGGAKALSVLNPEHAPTLIKEHAVGSSIRILRGNPRVFAKLPQAIVDVNQLYGEKQSPSDQHRRFLYEGGARGWLARAENIGEPESLNLLAKYAKDTRTPVARLRDGLMREVLAGRIPVDRVDEIVRYAGFLAFGEDIDKAGGPVRFGAARPDLAEAIGQWRGRDALAFYLSNHLFGPYDEMPALLRAIRDRFPAAYFGFGTAQVRAEQGLFLNNTVRQPAIRTMLGKKLTGEDWFGKGKTAKGATVSEGFLRFMAPLAMLSGLLYANNWGRFGKEEEEMAGDKMGPHLDLFHLPQGKTIAGEQLPPKIVIWDRTGALPGITGLLGLDDPFGLAHQVLNGKMTLKEAANQFGKRGIDDFLSLSAQVKVPVELATGRRLSTGGKIRDTGEYIADRFHLGELYRAAARLPARGTLGDRLAAVAVGGRLVDPAEEAYRSATFGAKDWINAQKGLSTEAKQEAAFTPLSSAMFYYKKALAYGDRDGAFKYLAAIARARIPVVLASERLSQAPAAEDKPLQHALVRMEPLWGMPEAQVPRYLKSLSPEEKVQLRSAYEYYRQLAAPRVPSSRTKDLAAFVRETSLAVRNQVERELPIAQWERQHPAEMQKMRQDVLQQGKKDIAWELGKNPAAVK